MNNVKYSKQKLDFTTDLRNAVNKYFSKNNIKPYGNHKIYIENSFYDVAVPGPLNPNDYGSGIIRFSGIYYVGLLMGLGMSGLGMVTMHDANHGSFSKNPKVNRFFGNSLYLLGGFPPNWRYQHNTLHHGFTNIEGHDEDIAPPGILRFSPHRPLKKIHRYQHIYAWFFYSLMTISWIISKGFQTIKKISKIGCKNKQQPEF